jgi:peptidoglycan/LPS O-acetylase OafA/YrhL
MPCGPAAISVLIYHVVFVLSPRPPGDRLTVLDHVAINLDLGLYVFFALSGYLVAGPAIRLAMAGSRPRSVRDYVVRRSTRLVPALWVVAAAAATYYAIVEPTLFRASVGSPAELAATFLFAVPFVGRGFTGAMGQTWTLSVEACFYASVPVLAALLARSRRPISPQAVLWGCLAVALVSTAAREAAPDTVAWRRNLLTLAMAFTPGVALAAFETSRSIRVPARLGHRSFRLAMLVAAVVCAAGYGAVDPGRDGFEPDTPAVRALLATAFAGAVLALAATASSPVALRVLLHPIVRWIGERSYGVYLLHQFILGVAVRHLGGRFDGWLRNPAILAVTLFGALALAEPLHRWVEVPALERGRRPFHPFGRFRGGVAG